MKIFKEALRTRLRHHRRKLSPQEQNTAAIKIAYRLCQSTFFKHAQKIALYLPFDGEVATHLILHKALRAHKTCYIPIVANSTLNFVKLDLQTPLKPNRFGILEPHYPFMKPIPPRALDLVIVPLVSFDAQCHRLGMGKGFYDKTFAFKKRSALKPKMIGLAYDFQKVTRVPRSGLDLLLDGVVSEKRIYQQANL